jgi:hypothetical protein
MIVMDGWSSRQLSAISPSAFNRQSTGEIKNKRDHGCLGRFPSTQMKEHSVSGCAQIISIKGFN